MRKFRTLTNIDGVDYVFCPTRCRNVVGDRYLERKKVDNMLTKEHFYQEIADSIAISPDTLGNWLKGKNGPSDLSILQMLASSLNVDYKYLLVADKKEKNKLVETKNVDLGVNYGSDREVINRVYKEIVLLACDIAKSEGYSDEYEGAGINPNILDENRRERINTIRNIVYMSALEISRLTYLKLHALINEIEEDLIFVSTPMRWYRIDKEYSYIKYEILGTKIDDYLFEQYHRWMEDEKYEDLIRRITKYNERYDKNYIPLTEIQGDFYAIKDAENRISRLICKQNWENQILCAQRELEKAEAGDYDIPLELRNDRFLVAAHIQMYKKNPEYDGCDKSLTELEEEWLHLQKAIKDRMKMGKVVNQEQVEVCKKRLEEIQKIEPQGIDHVYVMDEYVPSPDELFRWAYLEIINTIMREDFPDLFNF